MTILKAALRRLAAFSPERHLPPIVGAGIKNRLHAGAACSGSTRRMRQAGCGQALAVGQKSKRQIEAEASSFFIDILR